MVVRIITYLGVPDRRPDATPLIGFFDSPLRLRGAQLYDQPRHAGFPEGRLRASASGAGQPHLYLRNKAAARHIAARWAEGRWSLPPALSVQTLQGHHRFTASGSYFW